MFEWHESEEYGNGADGTCHECGRDLDGDGSHEDWHTLCWECWRAENGVTDPVGVGMKGQDEDCPLFEDEEEEEEPNPTSPSLGKRRDPRAHIPKEGFPTNGRRCTNATNRSNRKAGRGE